MEDNFKCVRTIRFSELTKIGSLKTDRVNGSLGGIRTHDFLELLYQLRHQIFGNTMAIVDYRH